MSDHNKHKVVLHERQRIKKRDKITQKAQKSNPFIKSVKAIGKLTEKIVNRDDKQDNSNNAIKNSGRNTAVPLVEKKSKPSLPVIDYSSVPSVKPSIKSNFVVDPIQTKNHFQQSLEERRKKEAEAQKVEDDRKRKVLHNLEGVFQGLDFDNISSPYTKGYSLKDEIVVQQDVSNVLNGKDPSKVSMEYMALINDVFTGKYAYGVTDKEFRDWQKNNTVKVKKYNYETGKWFYDTVIKPDAVPPPTGISEEVYKNWEAKNTFEHRDENGKVKRYLNDDAEPMPQGKQDINSAWKYYLAYQRYYDEKMLEYQEKMQHMAGAVPNKPDSFLDVVRDDLSGRKNLASGTVDYLKDYVFNPLRNHDWGTLGMNTLVNLGETMDVFGIATRSILSNDYYLLGAKGSAGKVIEGQKGFVYSGGKEKQKQILSVKGAESLLGTNQQSRGQGVDIDVQKKLKEKGLWDDFLKLKDEWNHRGNPGSSFENLKTAFTTYNNFNADTGNVISNLAVEVVLDPSLIFGGVAKAGSSAGAKSGARAGLEAGIQYLTKDGVDWVTDGNKVLRQFYKNAGRGMLMDNPSSINQAVKNLSNVMVKEGHISAENVPKFQDAVIEGLNAVKADQSFRFVRSLASIDRFVDRVDSALLKTSFAVPYVPVKAIASTRKVIRNSKWYSETVGTKKGGKIMVALQKQMEGILKKDGSVSIGDLGEFLKRMDESDVGRTDDVFRSNTINKFVQQARVDAADIQRLIQRIEKEPFDPEYIDDVVSDMISTITDGKVTTSSEFLDYIDNVFQTHVGKLNGELDEIRDIYTKQLKAIDDIKEANIKNFVNDFNRRLSEASTFEDIQNLTMDYVRFEKDIDNSDQFVKSLVDRANEFDAGIFSDPKDILRDFEYKNATSVKPADSKLIKGLMDNMDEVSKGFHKLNSESKIIVSELFDYLDEIEDGFIDSQFKGHKVEYDKLFDYMFKVDDTKLFEYQDAVRNRIKSREQDILKEVALKEKEINKIKSNILERERNLKKLSSENKHAGIDLGSKDVTDIEKKAIKKREEELFELEDKYRMLQYRRRKYSTEYYDKQISETERILKNVHKELTEKELSEELYDFYSKRFTELKKEINELKRKRRIFNSEYYDSKIKENVLMQEELKNSPIYFESHGWVEADVLSRRVDMLEAIGRYEDELSWLDDDIKKLKKELLKPVDVTDLTHMLDGYKKHISLDDIDVLELHDVISDTICEFQLRYLNSSPELLEEDYFIQYLCDFDKKLVDQQLSIEVKQDMEIISAHVDSFRVFDKYMSDSRFNQIIDSLTGKGGILSDLELLKKKGINNHDYQKLVKVQNQVQVLQAYNYFQAQLRRIPGLTDEQFYTIIDSVFGLTKGNPSDYYIKASRNLDDFIRKVNLNLNTLYGDTRVNLDGFRKEALDFESELYKDFSDEIKDIDLQNRIKEIMKDGHLDPGQDVDVQMLQVILRDKGAIDYYNNLAKNQDVFFTDIETQGLNSDLHGITAISSKKWEPDVISSDSSLDEIISYIENNKPVTYTTKSLSEDIDRTISDSTLNGLFSNDSRLGPNAKRSEMLDRYKEYYAVKGGEDIVTEEEVLQRFIIDLDKSFDSMGDQVPILVTHSTNGFDVNFISKRLSYYEAFPNHIVQTQDLIDVSQSTVERLIGLTNDHILTSTQVSMVQDSLSTLARTLDNTSPGTGFKLLEPRIFDELFDISDDLKVRYGINDFQEEFISLNKDINSESRIFNNSIMIDPFRNGGEIDSGFMKFYETVIGRSRQELDNLFRANREIDPDNFIPDIGYNIIFSTKDNRSVTRYFDVLDGDQIAIPNLFKINDFTKSVDRIISFNLKQNTLIESYFDDFLSIINYAKGYAQDLTDNDPLVYLKYIKPPETVYEAYAMAQVIWDKTLKYVDGDILKTNLDLYRGMDNIDDNVKDYVLNFVLSNKTFDIKEVVSDDTLRILKGEFDNVIRKNELPDVYSEKLMNVKGIDNAMDLRAYQATLDQQMRAVAIPYTGGLEEIISDAKQFRIGQAYQKLIKVTDYIMNLEAADKVFSYKGDALSGVLDGLKNIDRIRRDAMSAQVMDYILESDEALVSHLLFHNQLLIISTRGSDLHMSQVQKLIDRMSEAGDDVHYTYHVENDQLFIGLKNDRRLEIIDDSSYVKDETKMRIRGDDTVYTAPKYKAIDFPVQSELDRMIKDVYDEIDFLTEGKSIGSIGTLHTLSRHRMLLKSLPEGFAKKILSSEYTCDARFWHQASFDLSRIGDTDNVYKFTDFNDTDVLLSLHKTLEQVAGSASAERSYLDYFFGDDAAGRVSDLMADLSDEEKIACIKNNPDMACVSLQAVDTKLFGAMESITGFEVHKLDINDVTDLKIAESSGAVMVPYEVYLDMQEVFNKSTFAKDPDNVLVKGWSTFLKGWTKVVWLYKVGQLCSPGTWIRNWMDATMKMTGDVGSAGQTARYQLRAMELLINYRKAFKYVKKDLDLKYTTEGDVKRMFDLSPDKQIKGLTYEQFKFIEDWLNVSISGGESKIVKSITDYSDEAINLNVALKPGRTNSRKNILELKQEFDLIGDKYMRFEELEEAEVLDLCGTFNYRLFDKMSKNRFMEIWRLGREGISDEELLQYNQIVNELIRKRFKRIRGDRSVVGIAEKLVNGTFTPMSAVEEVVRFGEYLALEGQGFTKNEIFQKIEASQFNYDTKTMRTKQIEMLVGYYGFMDANIHYWCRQLVENPRMLRYIEHIYGELSWDAAFDMGEDPEKNKSLAYMMQHGGIPVGDSGLYLKANPSFLDPLNILLGDPNTLVNTLLPPFQTGINILSNTGGSEFSALLHNVLNSGNNKSLESVLIESAPIISSAKTRYYDTWFNKKPWERLQDGNIIEQLASGLDPSFWGVIKRQNVEPDKSLADIISNINPWIFGKAQRFKEQKKDAWDSFLDDLASQGKWYDANLRKVVPLSQYNEDGLNDPSLSFDEKARIIFIKFGLLWDNNQEEFVEPGNYHLGGLNRSWNFDNEGEWDKFVATKKRMTGKVWDNNQRAFVYPDDFIPGMLNDDCDWEEVQKYNDLLFGTKWDNNQGKFVSKDHYINGGLNSEDLSFQELCALKYAMFGEEWDQSSHKFVKTTAPSVLFDLPKEDLEKTIRLNRVDEKVALLERLGIISSSYAAEGDLVKSDRKGLKGKYVFTGDPVKDAALLDKIIQDFSDVAPSWGGWRRFKRWRRFHWRNFGSYGQFVDLPDIPKSQSFTRKTNIKFSRPYTSGAEYAALRMALYGYKSYEDYYKFEYKYNYNYRSPNIGPKKYHGSLYSKNMYTSGDYNKWTYYKR